MCMTLFKGSNIHDTRTLENTFPLPFRVAIAEWSKVPPYTQMFGPDMNPLSEIKPL